jgi:hypothetical protein
MRFPRNFGINRFKREMDSEMFVGMRGPVFFALGFQTFGGYSEAIFASSGSITGMSSRTG